jgi:putative nucleotidyltransferase with HDIG domain
MSDPGKTAQGNGDLARRIEELTERVQALSGLLKVGRKISSTLELREVLHRSFESVEEILNSERSSVWRLDPTGQTLSFFMARGEGVDEDSMDNLRMKIGEGIVGHAAASRKPVIIQDAPSDPRWSDKVDKLSGFQTKSILAVPLEAHGHLLGVLQILNRKDGEAFTDEDAENLTNLGAQIAIAMENATLYEGERRTFLGLATLLAEVIEHRDAYTGGHVKRVVSYSMTMGRRLGFGDVAMDNLKMAAILHDIGKIGIEDRILNKPGKLTAEEVDRMREHVVIGARILGGSPLLQGVVPGVRHHHERFDGGGYPDGLEGSGIPMAARIITVADTFDAMTTTRPYREALDPAVAIAELEEYAGTQFCPEAVAAFRAALEAGDVNMDPGDDIFLAG